MKLMLGLYGLLALGGVTQAAESVNSFTISGDVTYERKDKLAEFDISVDGSLALKVRLDFERAFPGEANRSLSGHWASVLLNGSKVSIRFAIRVDSQTQVSARAATTAAVCQVKPSSRDADLAGYALTCLAIAEELRATMDGKPIVELIIGTVQSVDSPGDALLKQTSLNGQLVYVWID